MADELCYGNGGSMKENLCRWRDKGKKPGKTACLEQLRNGIEKQKTLRPKHMPSCIYG